MRTVTSKDGSRIAYDRHGSGPVVILVGGALGYRKFKKMEELAALLAGAGFAVERRERHDAALGELLERVDGRLRLALMVKQQVPAGLREGLRRGLELVAAARAALAEGTLGYALLVARRT